MELNAVAFKLMHDSCDMKNIYIFCLVMKVNEVLSR